MQLKQSFRPKHVRKVRNLRRGVTTIPVIAFYGVALTLVGTWVHSALDHQQLVRRWHEKTQAVWLADAGLRRAIARVEADSAYDGERWQITAAQLGSLFDAEVEIQVKPLPQSDPSENDSDQVEIIAIARYPAGAAKRAQATKTTTYRMPVPTDQT